MADQARKMICPKCGGEMNHHADKLVHPATPEEARKMSWAFGGVVEETHGCPGCGWVASRRAA